MADENVIVILQVCPECRGIQPDLIEEERKRLGKLIVDRRKELGMKATKLAYLLNISKGKLSHIENGYRSPSAFLLMRIEHILQIDLRTELPGMRAGVS